MYVKYFTDLSSVELFGVLRLVKEMFVSHHLSKVCPPPHKDYKLYMTEICAKIGGWFKQSLA
jgi:hypothetical protein